MKSLVHQQQNLENHPIPYSSELYISGTITFSHLIVKTLKPRYQSFTRIGRQSQSLKRQVYVDWTSVSFPLCKPLHGRYKFERNHEKKIKNMANSMQYIVGANCFAPKMYCIEFAVGKKSRSFSNILCRTVVPGCTRKQYGKRYSCEKISFYR